MINGSDERAVGAGWMKSEGKWKCLSYIEEGIWPDPIYLRE